MLRRLIFFLLFLSPILVAAQEGEKEGDKDQKKTPPPDPNLILSADFEDLKSGELPDDCHVIDGKWSVGALDGGQALRVAEEPLVEARILLGETLRGIGGTIRARIKTGRDRRRFSRFGVGLHDVSGYRLRLFPVNDQIQLVKDEEVVQTAELKWTPDEWFFLELTVKPSGDAWTVTGRAWPESAARPKKASIDYISTETRFLGRAILSATPYAGLPIWFDDIEIRRVGDGGPGDGKADQKEE